MLWLFACVAHALVPVGPTRPSQTLQAGVDLATNGELIQIDAGTYPDPVLISGRSDLTIESAA